MEKGVPKMVFLLNMRWRVPVSMSSAITPTQVPSTMMRSSAKNSMWKLQLCLNKSASVALNRTKESYFNRLSIQRMKHSVPRPVRRASSPMCLPTRPVLQRLPTKRSLQVHPSVVTQNPGVNTLT